jgi:hypothetical protein
MPQVSAATSIGIGATVNVLSGQLFERVGGRGAAVKAYATQVSGAVAACTATLIAGSDVICQDAALGVLAQGLRIPDDQFASGVALPGDQLVLNITNGSAGAIVVHWRVDIENA